MRGEGGGGSQGLSELQGPIQLQAGANRGIQTEVFAPLPAVQSLSTPQQVVQSLSTPQQVPCPGSSPDISIFALCLLVQSADPDMELCV